MLAETARIIPSTLNYTRIQQACHKLITTVHPETPDETLAVSESKREIFRPVSPPADRIVASIALFVNPMIAASE
jgi:hypothetical protein